MQVSFLSMKIRYQKRRCTVFQVWTFPCTDYIVTVMAMNRHIQDITGTQRKDQQENNADFPRCRKVRTIAGNRESRQPNFTKKVSNQRKDFLHKQSRQIANDYDCVCIEDLDMKAMSRSLNFGKSVSDNGWGMFTTFLRYKLEEQGKKLVKVDRFLQAARLFCLWLQKCKNEKSCVKRVGLSTVQNPS